MPRLLVAQGPHTSSTRRRGEREREREREARGSKCRTPGVRWGTRGAATAARYHLVIGPAARSRLQIRVEVHRVRAPRWRRRTHGTQRGQGATARAGTWPRNPRGTLAPQPGNPGRRHGAARMPSAVRGRIACGGVRVPRPPFLRDPLTCTRSSCR